MRVLLLNILILILNSINSNSINDKIDGVELDVIKLSKEVENTFTNRCNFSSSTKCLYLSCASEFPESTCFNTFQKKDCENCPKDSRGAMLNIDPFTELASVYEPFTDPDNRDVRELTYSGFNLPKMFKSIHDSNNEFYK